MLKTFAAACLAVAAASAASAATVSFSATPADVDANPMAASFTGTYAENVTGSIDGVRRSPFQGTAQEATETYSSITGTARFVFGAAQSSISFVWGSPDTYNSLQFFLGNVLVDTALGFGNGTNMPDAFATFVDIQTAGRFDSVVFTSGQPAFEFAGLTTAPAAVPLPAGGLLLLSALGAAGVVRRRAAA